MFNRLGFGTYAVVAVLCVVVFCLGIWFCWTYSDALETFQGNFFLPDRSGAKPELIIQEEHSAVWSHLDNDFASDLAAYKKTRGILVQFGDFFKDDAYQDKHSWFRGIELKGVSGETVVLDRGDFDWIEVRSQGIAADQTLDYDHARRLFAGPGRACAPLDDCVTTVDNPDPRDGCNQGVENLLRGDPGLKPCIRSESLHSHFIPFGIMTYWQGEGGFTLNAGRKGSVGSQECNFEEHSCFSFRFQDRIASVEIHLGASLAPRDQEVKSLGQISKITVLHPRSGTDITHGEVHKPATDR